MGVEAGTAGAVPHSSGHEEAGRSFARRTGFGADAVGFMEIAEMEDEAIEALNTIMQCMIEQVVVPLQCMLSLMCALPKKDGSTRLIALMSTIYRMTIATAGAEIRKWDVRVAVAGDTAVAGRSPLRGAVGRALRLEVAKWRGRCAMLLLWDVQKFYDSIDPATLASRAMKARFPARPLGFGMMVHRGPRVLRSRGQYGELVKASGRSAQGRTRRNVSVHPS